MLHSVMPGYFFHQSYNRAESLKYRALNEELQFRKDPGEKDLLTKNGAIKAKKFPYTKCFAHTHYDEGKVAKILLWRSF